MVNDSAPGLVSDKGRPKQEPGLQVFNERRI